MVRPLKLTPAEVDEVWVRWRAGQAVKVLSRQMRVNPSTVRDLLHRTGGIGPAPKRRWEGRLSLAEREEISRGLATGLSLRMIAAGLGRAPSTVSREVLGHGGRSRYRAAVADRTAWSRAARPKATNLASRPALAELVAANWSWTGMKNRGMGLIDLLDGANELLPRKWKRRVAAVLLGAFLVWPSAAQQALLWYAHERAQQITSTPVEVIEPAPLVDPGEPFRSP